MTLQHTASHCNTLQHTATHCNTAARLDVKQPSMHILVPNSMLTLQHTTTHCNTLQRTATRYNTRQHAATHCNTAARLDVKRPSMHILVPNSMLKRSPEMAAFLRANTLKLTTPYDIHATLLHLLHLHNR